MMKRANNLLLTFFSAFFLATFTACVKDGATIVNGIIVNEHTGEPIPSAWLELSIYYESSRPDDYEIKYIYADANGRFSFQSFDPVYIRTVAHEGFLLKGGGSKVVDLKQGKVNDVTIKLIPADGALKLTLENHTAIRDTVYPNIYSPILREEIGISLGFVSNLNSRCIIPANSSRTILYHLASEETVDIYWSTSRWPNSEWLKLGPNKISTYISRNDTATFSISFK